MNIHKHLGCAVTVRAVKDFFRAKTDEKKQEIIKDLRSEWMEWLTEGLAEQVADKLESDPDGVKCRFKQMEKQLKEEELMQQLAANL